MTQEDLSQLAKNDTNGLLDCYVDSTMQEFAVGIQQYEAGFKKALELVLNHKSLDPYAHQKLVDEFFFLL